ncbi:MAG: dihydrodipicolinate synthase family protein [Rubripirellula sp.]
MRPYPLATVACFDPTQGELPRRKLDGPRLKRFLQRLSEGGAEAVLIAASTGQGHLRTVAELEEFFRVAAEQSMPGVQLMGLLRPEDGVETNARLLDLLHQLDYDVVFLRPGTDLPSDATDDEVAASLQPLVQHADRLGLPIGLYSISDVSGLPLTAGAAANLVQGSGGDAIVAIKVTEANYESSTNTFLQHPALRQLKIVQGWDPFLARALRDGDDGETQRCGVTSGPMSFALFQYLHILEAARNSDWDEVEAAQNAVTLVFESMQDDPQRFADLQRAKYIMGLGHPICGEVTAEQVERVLDTLHSLPRRDDRKRMCRSFDLMQDGPFHDRLAELAK